MHEGECSGQMGFSMLHLLSSSSYIVQTPSGVYSYWRIAVQEMSIYMFKCGLKVLCIVQVKKQH